MSLITIERLTKVFHAAPTLAAWVHAPWRGGAAVTALSEITLTIERGEVCCVMGSNGAGKTTLLRILATVVLPTAGRVLLDGQDVDRRARWVRSQIGYVPGERPGFYPRLTGRQNLAFFAALQGLSSSQARRRIGELIELLEIAAPDQRYQEYSTGYKQRLVLARALLHDPPILLLDEPTKSLDPVLADAFRTLVRDRLNRTLGKTVLWTTHQVQEAQALGGRLAIVHRGVLKACDSIERLAGGADLTEVLRRLLG